MLQRCAPLSACDAHWLYHTLASTGSAEVSTHDGRVRRDSDDWQDREDQERSSNGTALPAQTPDGYPRAAAAFSGTAAATAADLAARVKAANAAAGKSATFPDPTAGTTSEPSAAGAQ